jgi:hypothetical protein
MLFVPPVETFFSRTRRSSANGSLGENAGNLVTGAICHVRQS